MKRHILGMLVFLLLLLSGLIIVRYFEPCPYERHLASPCEDDPYRYAE
jgi:hypothetical protein